MPESVVEQPALAGRRFLVVMAPGLERDLVDEQLRGEMADVDCAGDGATATRQLNTTSYDALLLDDRAGSAATDPDVLRAGLPVVMLTSAYHRGERAKQPPGIRAVLARPYRRRELLEALADRRGAPAPATTAPPGGAVAPSVIAAPRVLLVDDSLVNQKVGSSMLRRLNCTVELAGNGLEALAAMERSSFDLVLMDCQMPELDGFSATRARRQREAAGAPRQTIAAMTAHAMQGDRERCLEAGMDDYVTKPVSTERIAELLERWLPGRAGSPDHSAPVRPQSPVVPVLDPSIISGLEELEEGGSPGLVADVVHLFTEQSERHLQSIASAVAEGKRVLLAAHLHALRGSASSVGASRLAQVCADQEVNPDADPAALAEGLDRLRLAYAEARSELGSVGFLKTA